MQTSRGALLDPAESELVLIGLTTRSRRLQRRLQRKRRTKLLLCLGVAVASLALFWGALVAQAEEAAIVAPESVATGQLVQLTVSGVPLAAIATAVVDWQPRDGVTVFPAQTWGGKPVIFYQGTITGKQAIWICFDREEKGPGYIRADFTVGEDGPDPPDPPDPPAPNPYPIPPGEWDEVLLPLSKIQLSREDAKQICQVFDGLASQVVAGGFVFSRDLRAAIIRTDDKPVGLHKKYPGLPEALGVVFDSQIPRDGALDKEHAASTLRFAAWQMWEVMQ